MADENKKMGRPTITFTNDMLDDLEKLLAMQATDEEVAAWFGVCRQTIKKHLKDNPALNESYQRGKDKGKASLRRLMWISAQGEKPEPVLDKLGQPIILTNVKTGQQTLAMTRGREPSVIMQVFLSKQKSLLGFTDRQEITGKDGQPLKPDIKVIVTSEAGRQLTDRILAGEGTEAHGNKDDRNLRKERGSVAVSPPGDTAKPQ